MDNVENHGKSRATHIAPATRVPPQTAPTRGRTPVDIRPRRRQYGCKRAKRQAPGQGLTALNHRRVTWINSVGQARGRTWLASASKRENPDIRGPLAPCLGAARRASKPRSVYGVNADLLLCAGKGSPASIACRQKATPPRYPRTSRRTRPRAPKACAGIRGAALRSGLPLARDAEAGHRGAAPRRGTDARHPCATPAWNA